MLSYNQPNIDMRPHQRQSQQHRRQRSTPAIFDPQQSSMNPGSGTPQLAPPELQHQVSMANISGQHPPQHYMQVAQTQYHARPGHAPPPPPPAPASASGMSEAQFRQLQHQQLDAHIDLLLRQSQARNNKALNQNKNHEQHIHQIERSRSNPDNYSGLQLVDGSAMCLAEQSTFSERPSSSRSAGYNDERFALQLTTAINAPLQRPATPTNPGNLGYSSPITPATTPFRANGRTTATPFVNMDAVASGHANNGLAPGQPNPLDVIDDHEMRDADATIRAHKRPQAARVVSFSEFFTDVASAPCNIADALPSPPQTQTVQNGRSIDMAAVGVSLHDVPKLELQPPQNCGYFDQTPLESPQAMDNLGMGMPMFSMPRTHTHSQHTSIDMTSSQGSPMRGPGSPQTAPFDDLSLDATIEDTGVSAEEVQSYIQDPTDEESKWTCLFPECGKKFGRKENIRSHVQTHLGDRQFKCLHCNKCFVRQHDLKRHSKIHSGVKPYPCICGNSFARHDALTRHRQRGICDGGFEGIVKRNVKRGRPRKERPDDDERLNKAARTRENARDKTGYASSISCTSESSWGDSPDSATQDPFHFGSEQFRLSLLSGDGNANGFAPDQLANTPPLSPDTETPAASPVKEHEALDQARQPLNHKSDGTRAAHAQLQEQLGSSQGSQQGSQAGSPPGLSHSSPPSSAQMVDFDWNSAPAGTSEEPSKMASFGNNDFDMFVSNGGQDELFGGQWTDNALFSFDNKDNMRDTMANEELFGDMLNFA